MADYKITNITFSTRQEIDAETGMETAWGTPIDTPPSDGVEVTGGRVRTTFLVAHISFDYYGQAGECIVDLQKICEIEFDENGKYTKLTTEPIKYNSYESITEDADVIAAIEKTIKSLDLNMAERSYILNTLGQYKLYSPFVQ